MDLLLSYCREDGELVPLLCYFLFLESLYLPVCVSLILQAREPNFCKIPSLFFFHVIQVHSKKLVGFSFWKIRDCPFRDKWTEQGWGLNAVSHTRVANYLWWEVSLFLASFPNNTLNFAAKSIHKHANSPWIYLFIYEHRFLTTSFTHPQPTKKQKEKKRKPLLEKHDGSYLFLRLTAIFSSYHDSKFWTPLRKT